MYKLYERVPKTKQYMYGSRLIDDDENPFLDGACLLCISAQHDNTMASKSNFGVTKEGMKMARLRVRGQKNAGFSLNDFPVKFLSLELDKKDEDKKMTSEERIDAFVTQYLLPLIANDGKKIDCIQAMKNMRNVNMMSYCDGTLLVQSIERNLINRMKELGYTDEECEKIQSQMCIFPISTDRLTGTQKSTCISFKDINDTEVNDNVTLEERQKVSESTIGESIVKYSDNEMAYLFSGDGTLLVQSIERNLINRMKELGYTDEECEKIQSQMCIFPISTDRLTGTQKSTCISFKDINDTEVNDNVTLEERQKISESTIGEIIVKYSDNEMAYLFSGDGEHSLKKYTRVGMAMSACLSSAVSKALENSILNSSNKSFVPISARRAYS